MHKVFKRLVLVHSLQNLLIDEFTVIRLLFPFAYLLADLLDDRNGGCANSGVSVRDPSQYLPGDVLVEPGVVALGVEADINEFTVLVLQQLEHIGQHHHKRKFKTAFKRSLLYLSFAVTCIAPSVAL